jgi:hypothetical protein
MENKVPMTLLRKTSVLFVVSEAWLAVPLRLNTAITFKEWQKTKTSSNESPCQSRPGHTGVKSCMYYSVITDFQTWYPKKGIQKHSL